MIPINIIRSAIKLRSGLVLLKEVWFVWYVLVVYRCKYDVHTISCTLAYCTNS